MPEYKQPSNGGHDWATLKDKTIAYEPNELKQLNTLVQHDQRLKVLPFGAIMNEPISHKCQCIHSVVPQLETTSTSQPG